jgi:hypothetical protein
VAANVEVDETSLRINLIDEGVAMMDKIFLQVTKPEYQCQDINAVRV